MFERFLSIGASGLPTRAQLTTRRSLLSDKGLAPVRDLKVVGLRRVRFTAPMLKKYAAEGTRHRPRARPKIRG